MPALVAEVDEVLRPSWVSARAGKEGTRRRARTFKQRRRGRARAAGARWGWAALRHCNAAQAAAQTGTRAAQSPPLQDPASCAPRPQEGQRSIRPLARTRTRRQLWYVCGPS